MQNKIHYTYWGRGAHCVCSLGSAYEVTMNPHRVTCEECKAQQVFKDHVAQLELAFDGNIQALHKSLRNKWLDEAIPQKG